MQNDRKLRKNNVIPSEMYCSECNNKKMKLENIRNKKRWRCTKCNKTFSLFKNTILENCKKDISEILDIIYFWSLDLTQNKAMIEGNSYSIDTIFNWYRKLKIQTYYIMINTRASKIGGIGHVVEVDEAKFSKRKYEIIRIVRSAWVVDGVDLTTGETFFVEVFYRNEDTLSQVLLDNIEGGTIVVIDC
ncbi:hypothetical protein H311_01517 [Anncaliia algerae PRA109]|nr:hypothetical protein H311_01517 [Anncaliia algerae PRA109]